MNDSVSDVYYTGEVFWNNFAEVRSELSQKILGASEEESNAIAIREDFSDAWLVCEKLLRKFPERKFARALFFNCGNGWVDRTFHERGLCESSVGIDIDEGLLTRWVSS